MFLIKKIVVYWLPPLVWMGLIYFLSSFHKLQASPVNWQDFVIRKTAHFLEFAILFVLYNRGLTKSIQLPIKKRLFLALALAIGYAMTDEFHQTMVLGRTGKPFDILVDSLGALAGLVFVVRLAKFLPEKLKKLIINYTLDAN